ncbi:hypothetical protein [Succinispira mobilis]|uniref:hypothetical protein n=1 Tax=Succinispira mobilis TaxID=78120 RepID=UPI000374CEB6|nr:hypothetical protein [Succinispira mobilis]
MQTNPLQGLISLIEKRYCLEVVNSHYILVDDKFDRYNIMLEIRFKADMYQKFLEIYAGKTSFNHVAWSVYKDTVQFNAEVGNNILLILDSLLYS